MKVELFTKNVEITEGIEENVKSSLSGLDKYFKDGELTAKVTIKTYSVGQKIEIELPIDDKHVLRQETVERDLYQAINVATDKLEKQIRKVKNRAADHQNERQVLLDYFADFESNEDVTKITKRKELELKPMSEEEAVLQFEIIGHDFFVFLDGRTSDTKLLYKRKDGEYGIITF
ncbi:ribosome-associated translation inhibitor RaiA [Mollicutes bacterium LVI A0039]|nr:ribosome-associated translation inhibitor RaiA [Mollicutes bacterium LVI A0039]